MTPLVGHAELHRRLDAWTLESRRCGRGTTSSSAKCALPPLEAPMASPGPSPAPPMGDRDSTCAWDCVLSYPHAGPCSAALPAPARPTAEQIAEWGDAVAAIRGCPGAPQAEAVERLIETGDALLTAVTGKDTP